MCRNQLYLLWFCLCSLFFWWEAHQRSIANVDSVYTVMYLVDMHANICMSSGKLPCTRWFVAEFRFFYFIARSFFTCVMGMHIHVHIHTQWIFTQRCDCKYHHMCAHMHVTCVISIFTHKYTHVHAHIHAHLHNTHKQCIITQIMLRRSSKLIIWKKFSSPSLCDFWCSVQSNLSFCDAKLSK